jgi:predicted nucleotidyltransferase
MRKTLFALLILTISAPLFAQKVTIDIPGLSEKAREVVDVTLDAQMLRIASKFLSAGDTDERAVRDVIAKLDGIYVRSYEFDSEHAYDRAAIDKIRAQLGPSWKKIVNVRGRDEDAEIYLDMRPGSDQPIGLIVINAEPRELTIVNIVGPIDLDQLMKLQGEFGIPKMSKQRGDHD